MTLDPPEGLDSGVYRHVLSAGPWLSVVALWVWSGGSDAWPLIVASLGIVAVTVTAFEGGLRRAAGVSVAVLGILVGFVAERQVAGVLHDWEGYWTPRTEEVRDLLEVELQDRRLLAGEAAVDGLLEAWLAQGSPPTSEELDALRTESRASAVALVGPDGSLMAWSGTHRGKVPEEVKRGDERWTYRDLPLFGYLYITSRAEDGRVGVVAYLLRASLPEGLGADMRNLTERFYLESGERIRITEEDPGFAGPGWDFELGDDRLLSVVLDEPEPIERALEIRRLWAGVVCVLGVVAWALLIAGGARSPSDAVLAALALVIGAGWVPVESLASVASLDSLFVLPSDGVGLWSIVAPGRAVLVGMALFALAAVLPGRSWRVSPIVVAIASAVVFPTMLSVILSGVPSSLLAGGRLEWIGVLLVAALPMALFLGSTLAHTGERPSDTRAVALATSIAIALCAAAAVVVSLTGTIHPGWAAAWGLPSGVAAMGVRGWRGWRRPLVSWSVATGIAATVAIPIVWGAGVEARLGNGERRLERLYAVEDVVLEDRLLDFAFWADSLDVVGAEEVTILYEAWRLSGLSESGHPVRLQIERRDGSPGEGLRVDVAEGEPQPYQDLVSEGRAAGRTRLVQLDRDDARYVLTVPLTAGRMVVAVAPPFPVRDGPAGLGPLARGAAGSDLQALSVLPLPDGVSGSSEVVRARTGDGWQVGVGLDFSNDARYRAVYAVDLPTGPLAVARAGLLIVLTLLLVLGPLLLGRAILRERPRQEELLSRLVISFRARVTFALFGFFALANAIFGTVAYRALSEASRRSAQVIAERVVEDAAGWYITLGGEMERLASQVGAELLEYQGGELREGSVDELVELGLYEGWIPFAVDAELNGIDAVRSTTETAVGRWRYVTAFRRVPDGDVLAAQIPLQAGSTALQTTDLVELLVFVVLLGGALSLGLAMVAGRALTRPIQALQVASESVGSGDLSLRLPAHRQDEFGAVFRAFNRMVGRVRRTRRQLVRTSRRTQLIMDEAAVGMVALDPGGKVTLVNPRAEELLGTEVSVGGDFPTAGQLGSELEPWLADYLAGDANEADSDFEVGERRVRVRVRRLGSFGPRRGVVVALDDVTDELRAERVLAWGEMARQVAHEVKNPLTPIKLSIQHVRRAWDDRHPDFERILIRNADAMLSEIDRLAEIAQSFSRFGAPGGDQDAPLEPVSVSEIVGEVMALYGSSVAKVRFEQDVPASLPAVVARPAELKEVLVNLLENARLAGEEGTRVQISARTTESDLGRHVVLAVEDDGVGIPAEALPRVFEPHFSTRSKGTGLGLAIVHRVVTAWGGEVSVESEVGVGTTVQVALKIWSGRAPVEPSGGPLR